MNYSQIQISDEAINSYKELFANCFPVSEKFSFAGIDWLYRKNPQGPPIGFDAWEEGQLVAHYACIPTEVFYDGRVTKMLLSLNTATHPSFQGKGLFSKLASMTYALAAEQEFAAVYGVANANSTPGFVRKLDFKLVAPLEAKVGVGTLGIDLPEALANARFRRSWDAKTLSWRCSNPANLVYSTVKTEKICFFARSSSLLLPAYSEHLVSDVSGVDSTHQKFLSPARLFLGLVPNGCQISGAFANIPNRLRPSPLNFIFKPLNPLGS
jgi:GNAT superfamily N-acetyltransferase